MNDPSRRFAIYSWLSIAAYLALALYFHHFCWGRISGLMGRNLFLLTGLPLLLFFYWRGYRLLREQSSPGARQIIFYAVLVSLGAVLVPSFNSTDIFSYINVGWQQCRYGENPYVLLPLQNVNYLVDPMLSTYWSFVPCGYGFLFAHLSNLMCQLGHGSMALTIYIYKAFNWMVYGALGFVVYFGARRLKLARPDLSLYLYLFNPLILLQALSNVHNDIIMTLGGMLSILCAAAGLFWLAAPALVCAILIKYIWLIAIPFLVLFAWQKGGIKALAGGVLAGLSTFALLSYSYIFEWNQFRFDLVSKSLGHPTGSLLAAFQTLWRWVTKPIYHESLWPMKVCMQVIGLIDIVLFAAVAFFVGRNLFRAAKNADANTLQNLVRVMVVVMFAYICIINVKFHPWYLVSFIPLALWLPEGSRLRRVVLVLSCTHLFSFTALGTAHFANAVTMTALPLLVLLFLEHRRNKPPALTPGETKIEGRHVNVTHG